MQAEIDQLRAPDRDRQGNRRGASGLTVSELWLPAVIAAAALALTSLFCVRPMRRAHGGNASNGHGPAHLG